MQKAKCKRQNAKRHYYVACPRGAIKFNVIYGVYLANKHPQICRAVARLLPKTMKIDVTYGSYQFSAVGVDVLDDPQKQ